jgi:selenocysteine-specific elongation factor
MSVIQNPAAQGLVVGTAGHIDHGKTSLIRALTGTDTDRLAEEKRRGISIDLGFAHLQLSNGKRISFVDVPGHERFIKNMLAGAGGIQAVLLVVAADESVKPQTREHFDICRLLGVRHGVIALTKADIASVEQRKKTVSDIRALCERSFLADALVIPVSAVTGEGLPELKGALSALAERIEPRDGRGLVRLPIDRSFALRGFGTVVTGTLWSGRLRVGDTVGLLPSKRQLRIRGLQVHGDSVNEAAAGHRTAVNLPGIEHIEIRRGDVLVHAGELEISSVLDISVEWLPGFQTGKHREEVVLHLGTAEVLAAMKILRAKQEEQTALARLTLKEPVVALPGDRFVLRRPSPAVTIAGGTVIDAFPAARMNRAKTVAKLDALAYADLSRRIQILVEESSEGRYLLDLMHSVGVPADSVGTAVQLNPELLFFPNSGLVLTKAWLQQRRTKLFTWLTAFHAKNPSAAGAPLVQARLGLSTDLAAIVFSNFPPVRVQGEVISLSNHRAQLNDGQMRALAQIESAFRKGGFQPPLPSEVLQAINGDDKQGRTLLESLVKGKRLVRISENVIFHSDVIAHICTSLAAHKGRRFSVPEFKQWMDISRKYAIPLLEYLDREHVTRREGDMRVVL